MRWRYRDTVLVLCVVAFFVTFFGRLAVSPVAPLVLAEFSVSNTQLGIAFTGMWLAYGLTQFPSGVLADHYGEKSIILAAVGGTGVMCLLIAGAPWFSVFVVCTIVLGGFAGLHYSVATTLLSRTFDDVGRALGLHTIGAPLAGLVAPVLIAWVGVTYGWRLGVATTALFALPVFVLFAWGVQPTEPRRPDGKLREQFQIQTIVSLISRPPIAFTLGIGVIALYMGVGLVSFLPTFLVERHGYSPTLAGVLFSIYFVVHGLTQVWVGSASDRLGRDVVISICMLVGVVGFTLLVTLPGLLAISLGVTLVAFGSSFIPALDTRFLDHIAEAERGTEFGLVRTVYGVLGSTGSIGVGMAADTFGWDVSFAIMGVFCLIVLCLLAANTAFGFNY